MHIFLILSQFLDYISTSKYIDVRMKCIFYIISIFVAISCLFHYSLARPFSDTDEDPSTSFSSDKETERALEKALAIIRSRSTRRPLRPRANLTMDEISSKILAAASTSIEESEPTIDGQIDSTDTDEDFDPDSCPEKIRFAIRDITLSTMKNIVALNEAGRSESRIQKQYRWYNRRYLPRFRECIFRGFKRNESYSILSESVAGKFREAREKGLPVRGYHLRN